MRFRRLPAIEIRQMGFFLLCCLSLFLNPIALVSANTGSSGYQIVELSNDLSLIARFFTAIALEQELKAGKVSTHEVVLELLDLKNGVSLDVLEKENVLALTDQLSEISDVVEKRCSGDSCSSLKRISAGLTALESIDQLPSDDYSKLFDDGSSLQALGQLKKSHSVVVSLKSQVEELIGLLAANAATTKIGDPLGHVFSLRKNINGILDSSKSLAVKFSQTQIEALEENKLKTSMENFLKLSGVTTSLRNSGIPIEELNQKMNELTATTTELKKLLSKEDLKKRIQLLVDVSDGMKLSMAEKSMTSGFFNGLDDFKNLSADLKSSVARFSEQEGIGEMVSSVLNLAQQLEPLSSAKTASKDPNIVINGLSLIKKLESAKQEMGSFDEYESIQKCVNQLSTLESGLSLSIWGQEQSNVKSLGKFGHEFTGKYNGISFDASKLTSLKGLITDDNNAATIAAIRSSADLSTVQSELTALKGSLDGVTTFELTTWATASKVDTLVPNASQWLKNNKMDSITNCLKNKIVFKNAKKVIDQRDSLTAVLKLKKDNKEMSEISKLATSQKPIIKAWNDFKSAQKSRKARSTKSDGKLEDAMKSVRGISSAVKLFRDLAAGFTSKNDIQALLNAEKTIEDAIKKVTDANARKELEALWNSESKKMLQNFLALSNEVNKNIKTKPEKLNEYSKFFEMKLNFDGMAMLKMRSLSEKLQYNDLPIPDYDTLNRVKNLDTIDFVNAKTKLKFGLDSFMLIVTFLSAQPRLKKMRNILVTTTIAAGFPGYVYALIGCGILAIVVAVVVGICVYRKKKKKDHTVVKPDCEKKSTWKWAGPIKRCLDQCIEKMKIKEKPKKRVDNDPAPPPPPRPVINSTTPLLPKPDKNEDDNDNDDYQNDPVIEASLKKIKGRPDSGITLEGEKIESNVPDPVKKEKELSTDQIEFAKPNTISREIEIRIPSLEDDMTPETTTNLTKTISSSTVIDMEPTPNEVAVDVAKSESTHTVAIKTLEKTQSDTRTATSGDSQSEFLDGGSVSPQNREGDESADVCIKGKEQSWKEVYDNIERKDEKTPEICQYFPVRILQHLSDWLGKYAEEETFAELEILPATTVDPRHEGGGGGRKRKDTTSQGDLSVAELIHKLMTEQNMKVAKWKEGEFPLTYEQCMSILKMAKKIVIEEPALVCLNRKKTIVVGDVHGGMLDLARALNFGLYDKDATILLLGDYVDRGRRGIDVVMLLCLLKIKKHPKTEEEWKVRNDILWGDPDENSSELFPPSKRIKSASNYSKEGHDAFLKGCQLDGSCRGHSVVENGIKPYFGTKCINIYAATNHKDNNCSGMAIVHFDGRIEYIRIRNTQYDPGHSNTKDEMTVRGN
ncbi:hypothetical protein CRE_11138 [Caenorhabditis remanei]|uniref:Serine/threonine specific protein phosphatases domain-containing protein n=1 Tax=Caenorhabditis remanei TaxID=31234 RepID=E3M5T3_CAERE|nr:hypothetical protein CRE_11138 [Caenorhabditis remanei]